MVHGKEQLACAMVKFKTESCFKLKLKEVTCRDEPAENIHHNPPPQAF